MVLGRFWILLAGALVSACSTLPSSGPLTNDVLDQSTGDASEPPSGSDANYVVADIDQSVIDTLKIAPPASLRERFGELRSAEQGTLKAGDQVALTIWETGPGGLFSASSSSAGVTPTQTTQIPPQTIALDGSILVPYAGRVKIVDAAPAEAQALVQARLHDTAAQPQVLLTVVKSIADQVTVSGDDIKGALIPLAISGDRILDVIALAGGIQSAASMVAVRLIRGDVSATVPLQNVIQDPAENVPLHPGDTLVVSRYPEFFTVLGAATKSTQITFDSDKLSLSEAVGRAGGLLDDRADAAGVFVLRYEPRETAVRLCSTCRFAEGRPSVPVVFRLDMRKTESLFAAQSFQMSNRDLLYIANAQQVQAQKVFSTIRDVLSPLLTGAVVDRAVTR